MAMQITNFNTMAMQQAARPTPPPPIAADLSQAPAGSVVVIDSFIPTSFDPTGSAQPGHGHSVSATVRGIGHRDHLVPLQQYLGNVGLRFQSDHDLSKPDLAPDEFKQILRERIASDYAEPLNGIAHQLGQLRQAGLHHAAVNLSLGRTQAESVNELYDLVGTGGPAHFGPGLAPVTLNAARAFDLDPHKLLHSDPEVAGPERLRLQQTLADEVHTTLKDSEQVQSARAHYQKAVVDLESQHNSVVVSAANSGRTQTDLKQHAGGREVKVAPDFYDNVLATPETTVVGAVQDGKIAPYSAPSPAVGVFATGTADVPTAAGQQPAQGTSFAAPRVSAVMAKLHELYPDKNSAEIETMLADQLSEQLLSHPGQAARPVLSDSLAQGFLSRF